MKLIWKKNPLITNQPPKSADGDQNTGQKKLFATGRARRGGLDYNRIRGWRGGPPPRQNKNWIPRIALVEAIVFALFIVNGYASGGFLRIPGLPSNSATVRTVVDSSVSLVSGVVRGAFYSVRSGSFGSGTSHAGHFTIRTSGHRDSATVGSRSGSSIVAADLLGLHWAHHAINDLVGPGPKSSNHSGGANKTGGRGLGGGNMTASITGGASHGSGGGRATDSTTAGAGTEVASGANTNSTTAGIGTEVASSANTNSEKTALTAVADTRGPITNTLTPLATNTDITSGNSATLTQAGLATTASTIQGVTAGSGGSSSATAPLTIAGAASGAAGGGDPSWSGATNNDWGTGSNWVGGTKPTATGIASFDSTFATQPSVNNNQSVGTVQMTTGVGQNVTISGTGTLTLGNASGILVDNPNSFTLTIIAPLKVNVDQSWTNNSGNLLTIIGAVNPNGKTLTVDGTGDTLISGVVGATNGILTKSGTGTLTLSGTNTYTGATNVSGGILNIQNSAALGATTGDTTVLSGATLQLQNNITVAAGETLNISGNGASGQNGALVNVQDSNTYAGPLVLGAATKISSDSGTLTLSGNISGATFGLTLTGAGDGSLTGVLGTGTGTLTKTGAGTWTLGGAGANTFTGLTTVSSGELDLGKTANVNAIGSGGLTINGGTVKYTGTSTDEINNGANVTISGGTLDLNNHADTIGSLTFNSGTLTSTGGTQTLTLAGSTLTTLQMQGTTTDPASVNLTFSSTTTSGVGMTFDATNNGTATINGNINLNSTATAGVTRTFTINDGTAATDTLIGGIISNTTATGFIKAGAGTLVLTGANSYTGATTISAGVLQLGNGGTTGSLSTSSSITDNANFTLNRSNAVTQGTDFSGSAITGSGSLTQAGSGTTTLNAANTYSGGTTLNAGTLNINNGGTATSSAIGTGTFTINGGTIDNTTGGAITLATNNLQTWNSSFTFTGTQSLNMGTGAVSLGTAAGTTRTITVSGNTLTEGGVISNGTTANSLTKAGAGTLLFNAANTYTGLTTVTAGTVLEGVNNAIAIGGLTVNGATAIFSLGANHTDSVGTVTLDGGGTLTGTGTSVLTSTGSFEMKSGTASVALAGSGIALNKTTSGTVTLSGTTANTYSGLTTVSAGILDLNKTAGVNAIVGDGVATKGSPNADILVNGSGTLRWQANDQIDDTVSIRVDSGGTVNFNNKNETFFDLYNAGTVNYGTGNVTITDPTWAPGSTNTVSGNTSFGTLIVQGGINTVTGTSTGGAGTLTVGSGNLTFQQVAGSEPDMNITLNSDAATPGKLVLNGNVFYTGTTSTASITSGGAGTNPGQLDLNGATRTFTIDDGSGVKDMSISAQIIGTGGGLTKEGDGALEVTGANTYTGGTTVNAGTLFVDNITGSGTGTGSVTVNSGGTLGGGTPTGTGGISGAVLINSGGNVAPGDNGGNTTAILSTGALTLASTSNFLVDINGPTVGTQYDQLNVTELVTLDGSNLVVNVTTTLTIGEEFTIINNEGTNVDFGQFAQGTSVSSGGNVFSIDYTGGDGNDVVLRVAAVPEPSTWIGGALAVAALAFTQRRRFTRLLRKA